MCILRYLPQMEPSLSSTTAVLWYSPAALRSNSEPTSTALHSLASPASHSVSGPGIGEAMSKQLVFSSWQK